MGIVYHWLGREHELVQQLDRVRKQLTKNFTHRQRLKDTGGLAPAGLDQELMELRRQEAELVERLEAVQGESVDERRRQLTALLAEKRETLNALQREITALQEELSESEGRVDQQSQDRLKQQLARTRPSTIRQQESG